MRKPRSENRMTTNEFILNELLGLGFTEEYCNTVAELTGRDSNYLLDAMGLVNTTGKDVKYWTISVQTYPTAPTIVVLYGWITYQSYNFQCNSETTLTQALYQAFEKLNEIWKQ